MALIDSAYSYYLTTYGNRPSTRYDAHKKSELRNIYNRIVALNKESPLYKLRAGSEVAKFAIDIKEGAQNIRNVVASISSSDDIMESLQKKTAVSSDEDVVTARYTGDDEDPSDISDFDIEVRQLALPQINTGKYLRSDRQDLARDSYAFNLTSNTSSYEFQFNVNSGDTNYTVQERLARLITNANIGLTASVLDNGKGQSALQIESLGTGLAPGDDFLFKISAGGTSNSATAIHMLGIDHVSQEAQNSTFLLNGDEHSSSSNTFTVDNSFEVHLKGISPEGEPATIGFKTDVASVMENIQTLTDAYNSVIETTERYSASQTQGKKLQYQMNSVASLYSHSLAQIGINRDTDGYLSIDKAALSDAIQSENPSERLSVLNDFKKSLDNKASAAILNPIEYVNKTLVAYKNPGRNFSAPYATSLYSGLMMDMIC